MEKRGYFGAVVFLTMGVVLGSGLPAAPELLVKPYLNYPDGQHRGAMGDGRSGLIAVRWGQRGAPGRRPPRKALAPCTRSRWTVWVRRAVLLSGVLPGDAGNEVESDIYTFGTAVEGGAAFGFVVFCDTQSTRRAWRLAEFAYAQRPAFTLIGGDLVSDGEKRPIGPGITFPTWNP